MRFAIGCAALLSLSLPLCATTHHKSAPASTHKAGTPAMDSDRAGAIQAALIKQGYLSGEPTRVWDAASVAAMQKLQSDNGWQTKYTPDARALIKLGLSNTSGSVDTTATVAPPPVGQAQ